MTLNTNKYNAIAWRSLGRIRKWIYKPSPKPYKVDDKVVLLRGDKNGYPVGSIVTIKELWPDDVTLSGWYVAVKEFHDPMDANWFIPVKE